MGPRQRRQPNGDVQPHPPSTGASRPCRTGGHTGRGEGRHYHGLQRSSRGSFLSFLTPNPNPALVRRPTKHNSLRRLQRRHPQHDPPHGARPRPTPCARRLHRSRLLRHAHPRDLAGQGACGATEGSAAVPAAVWAAGRVCEDGEVGVGLRVCEWGNGEIECGDEDAGVSVRVGVCMALQGYLFIDD